jgi:phosphatidylglycerophosphatase A
MPGTVGTLVGLPLAWGLMQLPSLWCQVGTALVLTLIAIPVCGAAEKSIGGKDPGCIVADEYATLPITVIACTSPWAILTGFIFHRLFDITKPPPIRQLQHLHGGFGIVIDDFLAALLALGCNHLLFTLV